jgi:DNA-binding transcriptional MocR family regulator
VDLEKLTAALARSQVNIHSLRRYYLGGPTHTGLVFGYGAVDLPQIREGLATLRKALAAAQD